MYHVVPKDDLKEHDPTGFDCCCGPFLDDGVVVHRSWDKREYQELAEHFFMEWLENDSDF